MKIITILFILIFSAFQARSENPLNLYIVNSNVATKGELDSIKSIKKTVAGSVRTALQCRNPIYYEVFVQTSTDKEDKDWKDLVAKGGAIRINALWFIGCPDIGCLEKFNDFPSGVYIN